jgi:hypothetical protein
MQDALFVDGHCPDGNSVKDEKTARLCFFIDEEAVHSRREIKKRQEEQKNVVGIAGDFNCECGAVRNRVADRISSAGGDRGEQRSRDVDHFAPQFLIVIEKHYLENILRTESAMVGEN